MTDKTMRLFDISIYFRYKYSYKRGDPTVQVNL